MSAPLFTRAGELLEEAIRELEALRESESVKVSPKATRGLSVAITEAETAVLWLDKVAIAYAFNPVRRS